MGKKKGEEEEKDWSQKLVDNLNSKFKHLGQVVYFLEDEYNPTDIIDWVPTGDDILDLAISNRRNGGWPVGRIIEIMGLEASGKTNLAAEAMRETQKKGGLGVYIDTESSLSKEFFAAIGVGKGMLYVRMNVLEDIFEFIEGIIADTRVQSGEQLITIVIDSVMGATVKDEDAGNFSKEGYGTKKAALLSLAMRKLTGLINAQRVCLILINQLRENVGAFGYQEKYKTSGGKAIGFHASVRAMLKQVSQIKATGGEVEGIKVRTKIVKNRCGPPLKTVEYNLMFKFGIDRYASWFEFMKDTKHITRSGSWFTYTSINNSEESIAFQSKDFEEKVLSNPVWKDEIYDFICDSMIVVYENKKGLE